MQSYKINFLQKQAEMLSNQDAEHFIFYETVLILKDIFCTFTIAETGHKVLLGARESGPL